MEWKCYRIQILIIISKILGTFSEEKRLPENRKSLLWYPRIIRVTK